MAGPAGRLIGRERERTDLGGAIIPGALVTVTGPGGVGKSRLATEVVAAWAERTGRPARIASLDAVPAAGDATAVAAALGFGSSAAATVALAEPPGTVLLDGCDHVLAAVRDIVASLRAAAPDLAVVCTTRQPLGVAGEAVVVVEPLAVPAPGDADAGAAPAVELFLDRAAAAGARLEPDARMLADIAELCRRLDGLPLAIELAAARARVVAPGELLEVVGARLEVLRRAGAGARVDTMAATIDLSTAQLTPAERTFFRRLGVFTGAFDPGLAHAVAAEPGADRVTSIDLLARLVERSLVVAEVVGTTAATTRYRLLELIHEHARRGLGDEGELAAVEERFVEAMLAVADRLVANALTRWDAGLLATARDQFANLARACELCVARDARPDRALRLLLPTYAAVHEGHADEVWALGRRVLDRWQDERAPWRAEALAVLASAAAIAGRDGDVEPLAMSVVDDPDASTIALALADRAWGLASRPRDAQAAARHFRLARAAAAGVGSSLAGELQVCEAGELDVAGDRAAAIELLDDAIARSHASDDLFVTVFAHLVRARVALGAGDLAGAEAQLSRAETAWARAGRTWWTGATLRTSAAVASLGPSGWDGSTGRWRAALDAAAAKGEIGELALVLRDAATIAWHLGRRETAATLWTCAPRSTAITVLPELMASARRDLVGSVSATPADTDVVESLAVARAALSTSSVDEVVGDTSAGAGVEPIGDRRSGELAREGDGWRITFAGRTTRARDMKGLADLAVLVSRPGREVHALELMGAKDVGGSAGPALDDRARRAYQERIVELQRDIDDARADQDIRRAERAELELDALVEQLSEAFGLGGRARRTGSSAERARTAVTYRVRSAIGKLAELHPELGHHLRHAVRTGTWCCYRPETDVTWTVEVADRTS